MSKIEVVKVTKDTIVKTGERFLNVQAVIVDGKTKVPRNYAFSLDTTPKGIEQELKKALALYETEKAQAEAREETDKVETKADKTIETLEDLSISN